MNRAYKIQEQIYFADEFFDELHTKEFAEFVQNNNSIFVVISREAFFMIPYGVDQIYRIKSGKGRLKTIECAYDYHRFQTVSMDTYKKNSNYRCLSKCVANKCIKRNDGECSQRNTARLIHEASAYK